MCINYFTKVFQLLGTSPIRVSTVALPLNPITGGQCANKVLNYTIRPIPSGLSRGSMLK